MEIEAINKTQTKTTLRMENLQKGMGTKKLSITNRIHEVEERLSGKEDMLEETDTLVKESVNIKIF